MKTICYLFLSLCFVQACLGTPPGEKSYKKLIHCLGQEELRIHKQKENGPISKLNRSVIGLVLDYRDVLVTELRVKHICEDKTFAPSLKYLEAILTFWPNTFYDLEGNALDLKTTEHRRGKQFVNESFHIFLDYLSWLQVGMTKARCLRENIPEVEALLHQVRYLQENVDTYYFVRDQKSMKGLFWKLKGLDKILKKCQTK